MTLRGKALPLLIAAALLAGPVLLLPAFAPAPTASTAMKRVPQHLMTREPGTAGGQPDVVSGPALTSGVTGTRASGTDQVIVLPIEFSDRSHAASHDQAYFDTMMNSPTGRSVNAFYRENSYCPTGPSCFSIQATVANWVRSSQTMSSYGRDGSGVDDANGPIYRLVAEAVRLADPSIDFSSFDRNADGVVDHVVVVHAGGAQESSTSTDLIWSHRWAVIDGNPSLPGDQRLMADGVQIYGYIMISEDSPFGVVAHEFGHDLGLPDLYDTDSSSLGVGVWDVMGSGSWNGAPRGTSPAHFSAWSKIQLGWLSPIEVTAPLLSQSIREVENNSVAYRLTIKDTNNGDEYFLVENRQRTGFDDGLPGSGLLIWHVDDSVQNNDNDAHRLVDLVEADEASGDGPDDAGDPWASNPVGLGPDTNPSSNGYGNIRTGWKVRNIGPSGPVIVADLSREVDDDLAVVKIRHPFMVRVGSPISVTVTLRNQGTRGQSAVNVSLRAFLNDFTAGAEVPIPNGFQTVATFPSGSFVNRTWQFTAASAGRYILDARVDLPMDEIMENNERLAHVNARTFFLQDDMESGNGSWSTPGQFAADGYRWQIVDDSGPYGNSHSTANAWRFGYFGGIPSLLAYHTLESPSVSVPAGPLYLIYYQTYDLSRTETPTTVETDHAYVDVTFGGGPWTRVAHFQGKDVGWKAVSLNLTPYLPGGASTVRVRFNVTAAVMPETGGWWIDDVLLTPMNFTRGVGVIPVVADRTIEPGAEAVFTLKVTNLGDFDDEFRFAAVLPSGWTATLVANATSAGSVDQTRVTLAPDAEATLQLRARSPPSVLRGTVETIPLTVSSTSDASQRTEFVATARINDPLGLGGIQKYLAWIIVLAIGLIVIVVIVDHMKSRRFRGQVR